MSHVIDRRSRPVCISPSPARFSTTWRRLWSAPTSQSLKSTNYVLKVAILLAKENKKSLSMLLCV